MGIETVVLVGGVGGIFLAIFLGLTAVGVFNNDARGVSKSLAVVEAFSAAPKALQQELDPSFNDRVVTPLLNRFVNLGKKLTPSDYTDRIRRKIDMAGNPPGWTVDRVAAYKVVGLGGLFVVSLIIGQMIDAGIGLSMVLGGVGLVLGYFAPDIYLYNAAAKRSDLMRKTFPDSLDLLTISVEAGLGFDAALSHVAKNTEGPVAEELSRVLQEMQIGLGRSSALRALGERTTLAEMRGFTSAMVQADAFGIPVGHVLRVQSSEIRVKRRQRAEEQAQKLPVKVLFPLIFFILPCLFIIILGPAVISIMDAFSGR